MIVTDGDRVLQIISNLLSNAFRWTPEGGRITLSLSAEDEWVSVVVSDSGPGISAEERERIFRPFWSRDGAGTGLGLAIARELASALGGRIELHSERGLGSRFTLLLPVQDGARASEANAATFARIAASRPAASGAPARPVLSDPSTTVALAAALLEALLDAGEPLVDAAPAGGDEVDEEREVVDAGVPLGEHVALEPLEPADELVHQAAHLGEVAGDREHLLAQAVLHRVADAGGEAGLELCRGCGERLDLLARPLERRVDRGRLGAALGGTGDPLHRALHGCVVHPRGRYTAGRTDVRSGHVRCQAPDVTPPDGSAWRSAGTEGNPPPGGTRPGARHRACPEIPWRRWTSPSWTTSSRRS